MHQHLEAMDVQNQRPVRIAIQEIGDNEITKSHNDESPILETDQKQIIEQLAQIKQQKEMYYQVITEEPGNTSTLKYIAPQIRGGDLGKGSSPGSRARSDASRAITNRTKGPKATKPKPGGSLFAEAFTVEPKFPARPGRNGDGLFGRFRPRPTPDPFNPGCAGGPKSITVLNQSKSSEEAYVREITAHDGVKGGLTDKSLNHLMSKHGHDVGIDDPLPPNPDQKPTAYKQVRTRINRDNKEKFADILEKILQDPNTEPFPGVSIREIKGRGYLNKDYGDVDGGFFIGIYEEGPFKGQIIKAQSVSPEQLEKLKKFNKID